MYLNSPGIDTLSTEYCKVKVKQNKFYIPSVLVDDWIAHQKDVIVFSENTEEPVMLLTPFDLSVEGKPVEQEKRSYQYGLYKQVQFNWLPDTRVTPNDWHRQLLNRMHYTWFNLLRDYLDTDGFRDNMKLINKTERLKFVIKPAKENVFRAFETSTSNIKVCLLGQDPYPSEHANGLAFSSNKSSKPESLIKIEKGLREDLNIDTELRSDLSHWVESGVLLLNASLTVRATQSNSHADLWKRFTRAVLRALNEMQSPIVFILLGKQAHEFEIHIRNQKHTVFKVEHPAAASHQERDWKHQNVFTKTNEILRSLNITPISWL